MQTLVIDRGQWLTGKANDICGGGELRNKKSGLMCCLGFYAKALGADDAAMNSLGLICDNVRLLRIEPPSWLDSKCDLPGTGHGERVEDALTKTNDNNLHPTRREARIAKLFKHYGGITVKFVGRYVDATKKASETCSD